MEEQKQTFAEFFNEFIMAHDDIEVTFQYIKYMKSCNAIRIRMRKYIDGQLPINTALMFNYQYFPSSMSYDECMIKAIMDMHKEIIEYEQRS